MASKIKVAVLLICLVKCCLSSVSYEADDDSSNTQTTQQTFKIEGKVSVHDNKLKGDWISETKVLVNDGELMGFIKSDGTFVVNFAPSGSHLVEIVSPNYVFTKIRVDINKAGRIRARKANFVQPNAVEVVPYPLRFHADGQAPFFEIRETWKVTDVLFNPMVIMMVLPLLFLFVMPKLLANADPETQKEMQSSMNMFQNQRELPEISDVFAKWFSNPKTGKKTEKALSKAGRRR
ncbi:endoplasmic reticulum membrane protein complex subunit 7-like [Rhopilema esculentum]|uniref:endoplasmic reticulum membrane protein complex subunit 7-like n=1 Tax=Rhopilema esculentum TaxID=499914 RepID=UPI0031DD1023|eukprot:gene13764-4689_t